MKVLFIAPLPPPTHGQSLASEVLLKRIRQNHEVRVVDMAKKKRPTNIFHHLRRALEVLTFFVKALVRKTGTDLIYFTISESVAGNLKDIVIYSICFWRLDTMYIHMLGGAGMKSILEKRPLISRINRFFVSRVRGVIVEGKAQAATFAKLIRTDKIHIVPNFAEDFLFVEEPAVRAKFREVGHRLKILYLSNLINGKGYLELADAYASLPSELRDRIQITFVGGFQSGRHESDFMQKIRNFAGLHYYGKFAAGEQKKSLYMQSHIFCLPTYYPYEGQPISILEAYATGCAVITTYHSGIPDVFADGVNGYAVEKKSAESIAGVIRRIIADPQALVDIGVRNRHIAYNRFRTSIYGDSLTKVLGLNSKQDPTRLPN